MELTYLATFDMLNEKIREMHKKVNFIEETFNDAIMFSNKTHYMDEIYMLQKQI